jgi:predicted DNA-binding protein
MYAIELPKELLGLLARLKRITGKPIARQVREAVRDYLEREKFRLVGETPGEGVTGGQTEYPPSSSSPPGA